MIAYRERNLTRAHNRHLNQPNLILGMASRDSVNETLNKFMNYEKKSCYKKFQPPRIYWYGFMFEVALFKEFLKQGSGSREDYQNLNIWQYS